jgi:hypothetical protein
MTGTVVESTKYFSLLVDEALRLQRRDDLVDHRAVLLAGLELAHDLPVGDLVGLDRAEHDGRVQQHRVDLPGAKGSERIDRAESH